MAVYGPGDIDPSTGQPYPVDPESVATYGLTLPHSGLGAAPAAPMRGSRPTFPWGGGAKPAAPMRGAYPNFPPLGPGPDTGQSPQYTGPPSGNGFPGGAGAPTQGGGPPPFQLPNSGFGGAPAVPMYRGAGDNPAGYPVTESGAPTPGHLPNYGPVHVGGSPTNPVVPDSDQGGSSGYSIWDLGHSIKNWMGTPTIPAAIGEAGSAAPGDTGGYFPGGGAAAPGGMPWAGNQGGQPATSSGMPWAGNNAGRPYGVGAPAAGGGGRVAPGSVNLGRGVPGVHPAVIAHAAAAAAQQNNSPFIGISRPNADVVGHARGYNSGVQGTALDLSRLFGGAPPPAAAVPQRRLAPVPVRRAPVRGPLHPAALGPASTKNYPVTESGSPTPMDVQDQSRMRTWPNYHFPDTQNPGDDLSKFGAPA